jgi:ATP-binding cassette subfamily F protein uup
VFDSVADGADFVDVGESRKHVSGYLQDFLFSPDRARAPVRALSGGERNRLLLARLFTRRFNLLVLDEPTNDLDIETLDLLEELLLEFGGTLLVVSHDREFLDHVVTSTFVFEGGGRVVEYAGGYTDWVRQRPAAATVVPAWSATKKYAPVPTAPRASKPRKLSFRETAELAELPDRIDALEREREARYASLADPVLLRDGTAVAQARSRLAALDAEIAALTERWEALETIATGQGAPS